jgi:hypothetical protein
MTPERMARLVVRWVRFYTRDVPTEIALRRAEEVGADLHDHIADERARGTGDRRIALSILSRMVRGMPADVAWLGQHAVATKRPASNEADGTGRRAFRWAARFGLVTALLLMVPLVAMQFSDEVVWTVQDFVFAGVLLETTGRLYLLAARKAPNIVYRAAVTVALAGIFILIWLTAAVGIIGSEDYDANLMYGGVLLVGIVGAVIGRFRSQGMARALIATALAQASVGLIALFGGLGASGPRWPWDVLGLTGFFVALWLLSAWLFRHAGRQPRPAGAGPEVDAGGIEPPASAL